MAGIYVDTSALGRVLLAEPDASVILDVLIDHDEWWSSELIVVELRRLGAREGLADAAERLLGALRLAPVDSPSLQREGLRHRTMGGAVARCDPPPSCSEAEGPRLFAAVLTYDHQLQAGCAHNGLAVHAPRAD